MIRYFFALLLSGMVSGLGVAWGSPVIDKGFFANPETLSTSIDHTGWIQIAGILPTDSEAVYELEFWNSIRDSKDSSDYEAYLQAYPKGRFAPLARVRAKRYKKTLPTAQPSKPAAAPKLEEMNGRYRTHTITNVRKRPSSNAPKIGELNSNATVQVTGRVADHNWYRIKTTGGEIGYVYAPLLSEYSPKTKTEPKPQPVAKQVDKPTRAKEKTISGKTFKDCPTCPEMVPLSPGQFVMGDDKGDRSERPAHRVSITTPFAIGKFEITVAQWQECVKAGSCTYFPTNVDTSDNAPIRDVSWDDTQEYIKWLSSISGHQYRLPSEAEWEYAARGGSRSKYWWGNKLIPSMANCKDCGNKAWELDNPADVGTFEANSYGISDMNGNVWEWVNDCWHKNYKGAPTNGTTWDKDDCRIRVIRGGSWRNDKTYIHSASRFKYDTYVRYILNGFRVARTIK